jgi:hypothetical protein
MSSNHLINKTMLNTHPHSAHKEPIFKMDSIQLLKLAELTQYTIIYTLLILPVGKFLDHIFPKVDKTKSKFRLLLEILLQMIIIVITMYYIRRIVKRIPFILYNEEYKSGEVTEVYGELTIAFVYVITQTNIFKKIEFLLNLE